MGIFKRAVAIGVLGAFGAVGVASTAAADWSDVTTPGWYWLEINDTAFDISDVNSYYPNHLGSGFDMYGWTSDAFDTFPYDGAVTYNGGAPITLNPGSVSADYVNGGLTTIIGSQSLDFGGGNAFDVTFTLTIQGSYARWMVAYENAGVGDASLLETYLVGNMGSDGDAHYATVGTNGLVTDDTGLGDPVIGMHFASPGVWAYDVTDGDDDFGVAFAGDLGELTLSLIDWDPCSFATAIDAMTALVPTLPAAFGATNAPQTSPTCLAISPPAQIGIGSATNQYLTLTATPPLDGRWNLDDPDAADWFRATALDLPTGLTLATEFDPGTGRPRLHLTGSAPAGTYVVRVLSYDINGPNSPLVSTFTVEVVLAATGSENTGLLWLALGLVSLGAGLVVVAHRVRAREE